MIRQSDTITKLSAALVAAQAELTNAPKETKGQVGSAVRFYTDLPTLTDHVRPTLAKHGLGYVQFPCNTMAGHVGLVTRLLHEAGEWIEDEYSMPAGQGAQGAGSALTYARRYALMAVLGIAADDDDGAAASQGQAKPRKPAPGPRLPNPGTHDELGKPPPTPGVLLYRRLKEPMSAATKAHLKEMSAERDRYLTVNDLDADAEWAEAVRAVLDGAPRE